MIRCQLLPWLQANHRHHTHYNNGIHYANYKMGWGVIRVSPLAHWLIHGVAGGSIWMKDAVSRQNKMAQWYGPLEPVLRYPNPMQRCLHAVARFNYWAP